MSNIVDGPFPVNSTTASSEGEGSGNGADVPAPRGLLVDSKRRVRSCAHNAIALLEGAHPAWQGVLARNTLDGLVYYLRPPPIGGWPRQVDLDVDVIRVQAWFDGQGLEIGERTTQRALLAAAELRPFNPLQTWLAGLRWDGRARLEQWLQEVCGVEDGSYTRAVGSRWLISAVARAMQPGCQADHTLVLVGDQGRNKTKTLKTLGQDLYYELTGDLHSRDTQLSLRGQWIVELGELASLRRTREVEIVRSFLTRTHDYLRAPYGKQHHWQERTCVFAATANPSSGFLKDETGGRRFWPVWCRGRARLDVLEVAREQLFAEAMEAWKQGARWWIGEDEIELSYAAAHAIDEHIEAPETWVELLASRDLGHITTMSQVAQTLGVYDRSEQARISTQLSLVLRKLGYERAKSTDSSRRVWRRRRALGTGDGDQTGGCPG